MSKNKSKLVSFDGDDDDDEGEEEENDAVLLPTAAEAAGGGRGGAGLLEAALEMVRLSGAFNLFERAAPKLLATLECCLTLVILSLVRSMVISHTGFTALWLMLGGRRSRGWSVVTIWNDRGILSALSFRTMSYSRLMPLLGMGTP